MPAAPIREVLPGVFHWCNETGLDHFGPEGEVPDLRVRGFRPGDLLPGGIESHEVGVLCPDETAFRISGIEPALAVADGVVRDGDGPLMFVPDSLLSDDDPEAVKQGLKAAFRRLLALDFDHLLLAHGNPWLHGAKTALAEFVAR